MKIPISLPLSRGRFVSRILITLVASTLLISFTVGLARNGRAAPASSSRSRTMALRFANTTSDASPVVSTPTAATATPGDPLTNAINKLISGEKGIYGIIVMPPGGSFQYHRNEDTPFISASLYKLVLMANIYQKREDGELSFDQTIELLPEYFPDPGDFEDSYYDVSQAWETPTIDELMFAAGAYSSNVAANALLTLTDAGSLDKTTIDLGLEDTYLLVNLSNLPSWPPSPTADGSVLDVAEAVKFVSQFPTDDWVNITTPRDMAHFFDLLFGGKIISREASSEMLDILKQQMVDDRFPYLLPYPTDMAHKTGNLDHVVHDVGIIWAPKGPVILVAMVQGDPNDDRSTQIIQRLALIAYGDYNVPPFTEHAVPIESSPVVGEASPTDEVVDQSDDSGSTDESGDTQSSSDDSEPPPEE